MKTLNLDLPYKKRIVDAQGNLVEMSNVAVSDLVVRATVNRLFPQQMPRTDSRIWAKVSDKLFDAEETKGKVELEDTESQWLQDIFNKAEPHPAHASWFWLLHGELNHE